MELLKVDDVLRGIETLFLDTAPVIYYVEKNPRYFDIVRVVFDRIDAGSIVAVTSPVTLAECLIAPYRLGLEKLQQDFFELLVYGRHTVFTPLNYENARQAAKLRVRYNLTLPDALQFAIAIHAGCDAILTNDKKLSRVSELRVLILDELRGL